MSHFKKKKSNRTFHIVLVKPADDFCPIDWRQKPSAYEVIEYCGSKSLRGQADAWRFLYNQAMLKQEKFDQWGVIIDDLA